MTKEELYSSHTDVVRRICNGDTKCYVGTRPGDPVTCTCDDYTLTVADWEIGWYTRAQLELIQKVVNDLEQKLSELEIEDVAPQERALRKVTIRE